jgi:hypothetical protein
MINAVKCRSVEARERHWQWGICCAGTRILEPALLIAVTIFWNIVDFLHAHMSIFPCLGLSILLYRYSSMDPLSRNILENSIGLQF